MVLAAIKDYLGLLDVTSAGYNQDRLKQFDREVLMRMKLLTL